MAWIKKLLDALPLNGNKTKIGVFALIVQIIVKIHEMCANCGLGDLVAAITADKISWVAVMLALIGLWHKQLKTKVA